MRNLHTPPFFNNLYRDLRDRRLLLPAAALLIALVVVPVALSDSPTTTATAPPPAAASGSQKPTPTEPAVLAEQLGVTDYQKRLEQLQGKNPFERQYVDEPADTGSAASTATGVTTSTSTSATTAATSAATSVPTSPAPTTSAPSTSSAPSEPPEPALFVFQADVSIGIPGDLSRRKHVKLGSFLPSESKPMAAFIGATQDLKHALFVVSDDITSVDTDGRCVPGENNCKLLKLKVGDEAKLLYAPEDDRTYKLRLHGIDLVEFDTDASAKRGKRGPSFDAELAVAGQG